jgi:hypothetical protein
MACRAVHFAITNDDLQALRDAGSDAKLIEVIQEVIEERWEKSEGYVCETDKAWDAIHRCLTDGKLEFENGTDPLRLAILGGEQLHSGDDYIVALVTHDRLRSVADALAAVTPEFIRDRYVALPDDYETEKSSEDCNYTWGWFSDLPESFDRAEKAGRHVIFTVDQ